MIGGRGSILWGLLIYFLCVCPAWSQEISPNQLTSDERAALFAGLHHVLAGKVIAIPSTIEDLNLQEDIESFIRTLKLKDFEYVPKTDQIALARLQMALFRILQIKEKIALQSLPLAVAADVNRNMKDIINTLKLSIDMVQGDADPLTWIEMEALVRNIRLLANEAQDTVLGGEFGRGVFFEYNILERPARNPSFFFVQALMADYFNTDPHNQVNHQIRIDQDQHLIRLDFEYRVDDQRSILPWDSRERQGGGFSVLLAMKFFEKRGAAMTLLTNERGDVTGYSVTIPFVYVTRAYDESQWIPMTAQEIQDIYAGIRFAVDDRMEIVRQGITDTEKVPDDFIRDRIMRIEQLINGRNQCFFPSSEAEMVSRLMDTLDHVRSLSQETDFDPEIRDRIVQIKNMLESTLFVLRREKVVFDPAVLDSFGGWLTQLANEPDLKHLIQMGSVFESDPQQMDRFFWMALFGDFYDAPEFGCKAKAPKLILDTVSNELVMKFLYRSKAFPRQEGRYWTTPWAVHERYGNGLAVALSKAYFEHHMGAKFEVITDEEEMPLGYRMRIPLKERGDETKILSTTPKLGLQIEVMDQKIESIAAVVEEKFRGRQNVPVSEFEDHLRELSRERRFDFADVGVDPIRVARELSKISESDVGLAWSRANVLKVLLDRVTREVRRKVK